MKLNTIITGMLAAAAFAACTPALNVKDAVIKTESVLYEIPAEGGSVSVTFQSSADWSAVVSPANSKSTVSGVSVSPSSGKASSKDITITVKAGANPGDSERQILVSIIGESSVAECAFRVSQSKVVAPGEEDSAKAGSSLANPYPANKLVEDLIAGNVSDGEDLYIRGIVSKIKEISAKKEDGSGYGNATFWITDDGTHPEDDNAAFQVYRAKGPGLTDIINAELLNVGDVVTIKGPVTVYTPSSGAKVPETKANEAAIVAVNGLSEPQGDGTLENPCNVAQAMETIAALESGVTPELHVKGFISQIIEVSPSYGNATFYITDDGSQPSEASTVLQIFRSKYFGGANYVEAEQLAIGDEVVIRGKLKNYVKDDVSTPEMDAGGIMVLHNGKSE